MKRKWKCGDCNQTSSRHWNMKVHIQRKHNGLGVPLLLDTQTFHETEGYAVRSSDSMESPLNYYRDIDPQAHFAASDPLETMYANLMKIKKQKQMLQRIESLATEIFNPVTYLRILWVIRHIPLNRPLLRHGLLVINHLWRGIWV